MRGLRWSDGSHVFMHLKDDISVWGLVVVTAAYRVAYPWFVFSHELQVYFYVQNPCYGGCGCISSPQCVYSHELGKEISLCKPFYHG